MTSALAAIACLVVGFCAGILCAGFHLYVAAEHLAQSRRMRAELRERVESMQARAAALGAADDRA